MLLLHFLFMKEWSNDFWKFSFAITGINYALKYIEIEISFFLIGVVIHSIVFSAFLIR